MRILFVAPWLPSSIRPRSLGILARLARDNEVHFVGLGDKRERTEELKSIPLASCTVVRLSRIKALVRAVAALPTLKSLQVSYVSEPAMIRAVQHAVNTISPDVVHFNVIRSAAYLDTAKDIPVMFDMDEVRSEYYSQNAADGRSKASRLLGHLEAPRMRIIEQKVSLRAQRIFMSSPADTSFGANGRAVLLRSPFFTARTSVARVAPPKPLRILFVGRMSFAPNDEAIRWFIKHAWPSIIARFPDATLDVVGERPSKQLKKLEGGSVTVHGFVESLDDFYEKATVAIAPIRLGTGVQMKVLQSLGAGIPTIVTHQIAERAGLLHKREVIVADGAEQWVDAISQLFGDASLYASISEAAVTWIGHTYADENLYSALTTSYGDRSDTHD